MNLKVLDPKGIRYGGSFYPRSKVIYDARPREANLLIALGKAEPYTGRKKQAPSKGSEDYATRDMKAE